jgi:hypothetical protein
MVAPSMDLIGRLLSCAIVLGASLRLTVYLLGPDFDGAGGQDLVLHGDRIFDILRRETVRLQRLRVEIDLDLAHQAAIGIRNGDAGDRAEHRTHKILRQVEHLLLAQGRAGGGDLQDRLNVRTREVVIPQLLGNPRRLP